MSEPSPTLESLIALGFERVPGGAAETVRYEFQNFQLDASSVSWGTGQMVNLSGHGKAGTSLLFMGPSIIGSARMIPDNLEPIEAAAWVSFKLYSVRNKLGPLPDWFREGERNWLLVPPAREILERGERLQAYEERERAYEASPKCRITREDARPIRRSLNEELSRLDGETVMTVQFDGRVLSLDLFDGSYHQAFAFGDSWPHRYRVFLTPVLTLPRRFERSWVEVSIFEGHLCWDRLPLGPCEAIVEDEGTRIRE